MTLVSKSAISYKNPKIACFHFSFRVCIIMNDNEWQLISSHILKFWRVNAQWDNTYYSEKIDNLGKPSSIGSVLRWQNPQGGGRSKEKFLFTFTTFFTRNSIEFSYPRYCIVSRCSSRDEATFYISHRQSSSITKSSDNLIHQTLIILSLIYLLA